jgi:hypothetical protein
MRIYVRLHYTHMVVTGMVAVGTECVVPVGCWLAQLVLSFWRNRHEINGSTGNLRVDSCGMYKQRRRGTAAHRCRRSHRKQPLASSLSSLNMCEPGFA